MSQFHFNDNNNTILGNIHNWQKYQVNDCYVLFGKNPDSLVYKINSLANHTAIFSQSKSLVSKMTTCFLIISALIIFFGNLLVITAVATTKRLRRVTDLYIVSLAVADLLVAVFILPLSIIRQSYGYWPYESHELCLYFLSANILLCLASILNLCCISVDRYIAIVHPLKYISKRTRQTALTMIAVAWISSFLAMLPPILSKQHHTGVGMCYIRSDTQYRMLSGILGFCIPFPLVGFIYLRIFWVIQHRSKASKSPKFSSRLKEHRYGSLSILFDLNQLGRIKKWFSSDEFKRDRLFVLHGQKSKSCTAYIRNNRSKNTNPLKPGISTENDMYSSDAFCQSPSCSHNNYFSSPSTADISQTMKSCPEPAEIVQISLVPKRFRIGANLVFPRELGNKKLKDENKASLSVSNTQIDNKTKDDTCITDQSSKESEYIQAQRFKRSRMDLKLDNSSIHINLNRNKQERQILKREQKTARSISIVVGCFMLCWFPFATLYLVEGIFECLLSEQVYMITGWFAYLNSMCNPFIYSLCNKEYANAFKRLLHFRKY
ncbi:unnamed protein product [Trichobilharzia szidati]|nr:unnamed protein product [Trichobilharzia szidati]